MVRPWLRLPIGLERASNLSRRSLVALGLNPGSGLQYRSPRVRNGLLLIHIYCVKVEAFFLTANDREKAGCKGECEARRKSAE